MKVPGDQSYGTSDFCVMKYEAKCSNADGQSCLLTDTPTSTTGGTPWVSISQTDAEAECASIGAQLISNEQWMTIATNIANQGNNWNGGTVGTGALYAGHNDNSPSNALEASSNDSNGCFGTVDGSTTTCTGATGQQRRTHSLSNGEVIWDMAGNVWEWTSYYDPNNKPTPASSGFTEYYHSGTRATGTTEHPLTEFISQEGIDGNWSRNEGTGYLYPGSEGSGGALRRGGAWLNNTGTGVFAASLYDGSSYSITDFGFRCVRL